jgi:hypothetical protein
MLLRLALALAVYALFVGPAAAQTVVRFETTMGTFDMVLNPTNNPRLQGNVDNILAYVAADRYRGVWINRADTGFVLQMGGFYSHTKRPPRTVESGCCLRPCPRRARYSRFVEHRWYRVARTTGWKSRRRHK